MNASWQSLSFDSLFQSRLFSPRKRGTFRSLDSTIDTARELLSKYSHQSEYFEHAPQPPDRRPPGNNPPGQITPISSSCRWAKITSPVCRLYGHVMTFRWTRASSCSNFTGRNPENVSRWRKSRGVFLALLVKWRGFRFEWHKTAPSVTKVPRGH